MQSKFYQDLYSMDTNIEFTFTNSTQAKLSQAEKDALDQDIT